jgi:F0F1-type ATP synthase membrane subunit b/b'
MKEIMNVIGLAFVNGVRHFAQFAAGVLCLLMLALLWSLLTGCSSNRIDEYENRIESNIADIDREIDILKEQVEHAGRDLRVEWFQQIDDLELRKHQLNTKLAELQSSPKENLQLVMLDIDNLLQPREENGERIILTNN